jgi:hypothetical protein
MNLQIKASLSSQCVAFLRQKVAQFDARHLEYLRLYDRTCVTATQGVWGRCRYPSPNKKLGYRIRCCASIAQFPNPVKWAVGTQRLDTRRWEWVWREDRFRTLEEAFVWIAGHESFHWLRHSRQIAGRNYETQANRFGFAWLDEWREIPATSERRS